MEIYEMESYVRSRRGKGVARKLRAKGQIPAVCYRKGIESIAVSIEGSQIQKILKKAAGRNTLIRLKINDEGRQEQKTVMLKDLQRDHLSNLLHVDLLEVLMDEKIVVEVPVRLTGESLEISRAGATIQQVRREIEVECLPSKIPDYIDVDISSLKLGNSIQVGEISIDPEIRIMTDAKEPIVTIIMPEKEGEEKPAEEAVAEPEEQ